jgi:hypothetical protein
VGVAGLVGRGQGPGRSRGAGQGGLGLVGKLGTLGRSQCAVIGQAVRSGVGVAGTGRVGDGVRWPPGVLLGVPSGLWGGYGQLAGARCHTNPVDVSFAGLRHFAALAVGPASGGRDEELVEPGAPKGATARTLHRHTYLPLQLAVRVVPADLPTVPAATPDEALVVHCQAIRDPRFVVRQPHPVATVGDLSGGGVKVVGVEN